MNAIAKNPAGARRRDAVEAEARHRAKPDAPAVGKIVTFYGASDDLVEVEGDIPGCDEFPVGPDGASFQVAGLFVQVCLGTTGCWGIGVGQIDEDVPVQASVIDLYAERYTIKLKLAVPMGAYVARVA